MTFPHSREDRKRSGVSHKNWESWHVCCPRTPLFFISLQHQQKCKKVALPPDTNISLCLAHAFGPLRACPTSSPLEAHCRVLHHLCKARGNPRHSHGQETPRDTREETAYIEAVSAALCRPTLPNTALTGISGTATFVTLLVESHQMFHKKITINHNKNMAGASTVGRKPCEQ